MGTKYTVNEFLIVGWQDDDLPSFGQIQYIVVVSGNPVFVVNLYVTQGIERHYHSFIVQRTSDIKACYLSELADYQPLQAHRQSNGYLCITFHSHIENTCI